MPRTAKIKPLFVTSKANVENLLKKRKNEFGGVNQIASSVDWKFKYAFYKPVPPTKKEIENFKKRVEVVKQELELLKRAFKPVDENKLKTVEEKLNSIVEDYKNYPFSDRELFFRARLKFLQTTLRKCFIK